MNRLLLFLFALNMTSCATKISSAQVETASLHLQIANDHLKKENYPLALKELLIAEKLNPEDPVVQANLGLVYFIRDRFELAEKHYRNSIFIRPDYTDAKNNLGRVYIEIGQYKKAEALLNDVLADLTYIDFSKAYANYGVLEFKRNNYKNAITYFKKSLERDRENCYTQVYLGRSYLEQKDAAYAVIQLDKAIPFCQQIESDEAHFYSAVAFYRNDQKDKAKFRFEELIRLFPSGHNIEKAQKMLRLLNKGAL